MKWQSPASPPVRWADGQRLSAPLSKHSVWSVDCEYDRYGQVGKGLEGGRECSGMRATNFILPDVTERCVRPVSAMTAALCLAFM